MNYYVEPTVRKEIKEKYKVSSLLSKGTTNAKTVKNSLKSFILYMSPHTQNSKGINLCPHASEGCAAACLFTAGRGRFSNVQTSRTNKTELFVNNKKLFLELLAHEIQKEVVKARKEGEKIAFRLNGTSDIDFVFLLKKYVGFDIKDVKDVAIFYDYTKILNKAIRYKDAENYFVTFSRSESNDEDVEKAIESGINVAIVFNELPNKYKSAPVINGDKSDIVMVYNKGVVLGLKAKGEAKKDNSGFVINN